MMSSAHEGFEASRDRTLYWTLSFHVQAERLWTRDGAQDPAAGIIASPFRREAIERMQASEPASRALRDAIEPLFNDISDREHGGRPVDFLLAVETGDDAGPGGATARDFAPLTFLPPPQVSWTTEGRRFTAAPAGLAQPRPARMRRFWFVHANGALSWHLSITLDYRHDPADYLFLSMLQKLAAPKEFTLDPAVAARFPGGFPVFSEESCGIDPLDNLKVVQEAGGEAGPFWAMAKRSFDHDAEAIVARLSEAHGCTPPARPLPELLDLTGMIEVPGLVMPRCRTMMYIRDARFFERLSPRFDAQGNRIPRRLLVQDECYAPYADRLGATIEQAGEGEVILGDDGPESYWAWARERPEYAGLSDSEIAAIRSGDFRDETGEAVHVPSFERGRTDCLDYLFLSGFNQNIIDFVNQDTSEILDGTDPIYPTDDDQAREGFFVRFANHRSMITYAARSRSLEVGNDYIGTCPYAFLVHVLSMHNEFLARDFETRANAEVADIEAALAGGEARDGYARHARRINALRIARYRDYEQQRYVNVFRYDTERDLFAELEQLRGIHRKDAALELALDSLEDHADDLEAQRSAERERNIGAIAFVLSAMALAQGFVLLAQFSERFPLNRTARLVVTEGLWWISALLLAFLLLAGTWIMITRHRAIRDLLAGRPRDR